MSAAAWRGRAAAAALVLLVASYPFAVAAGIDRASARLVAAALMATAAGIAALSPERGAGLGGLLLRRFGLLGAVALGAGATGNALILQMLPSLTSLWLLATFARSLRGGSSIVERFAATQHDGFPSFLSPYCRRVTMAWCAFFAGNSAVAAFLAVRGPAETWAWYCGFFSYVLVALLATAEYVAHKVLFRFYEDRWDDALWRRVCPPEATALGRRTLAWQQERRAERAAGKP